MPSAQQHYPFGSVEAFEVSFPADFICEAIDQTRGWFYSLLAVNTLVFDATPYRNVVCLGHIVDEHGLKMSKSRGNVLDPWDIFDRFGADALRWYFFAAGQPWTPRRVSEDGIREATRKTLLTFWNVFSFFATYADLDGWTPDTDAPAPTHHLDRWVLSELDDAVAVTTEALESFDALTAASRIAAFVEDLSNWYVRRSRPRFWKASDPAAHATLHECLVTTAALLAPFCPFLADEVHVALTGDTSVHLADWPVPEGRHDPVLASRMAAVRRLVALGRAARTDAKVKVRQPLRRALLLHPGADLDEADRAEIADELNVRSLEDIDTLSGLVAVTVVPNFRRLGPRLGPRVNEVKTALAGLDGARVQRELDEHGAIEVAGEHLEADDVEIRADRHRDFALAQDGPWAVALDLDVDEDLRLEGTARELVRALNDLRKALDLQIADRVQVSVAGGSRVRAALDRHRAWIAEEVLAVELAAADHAEHELDVDGEPARATVVPVAS
jgi:isoleucyl-tRNA synthetase